MASPVAIAGAGIGTIATIAGGAAQIEGINTNAQAQKLGIQGQILQTIGQAFGFETQAQQYGYQANINKYQAGVADINKKVAQQNAAYARDVGEVEAQQSGMKSRADLSEMKAAQGASGLDVNVGSAVGVRESMIELGYYNQSVIRATAAQKAYGYDVEATQAEAQADVYRYTAQQNEAQVATSLQAADLTRQALPMEYAAMGLVDQAKQIQITGSIASTVGSVASKWTQASNVGMFSAS